MQVESDDEEKKVLLIEENIQLLEESERVCNDRDNSMSLSNNNYFIIS